MAKWNDTDEPIGYLITFRTYGTWLPGDQRGSIDRYHNKFGGPRAVPSSKREAVQAERLSSRPFILDALARMLVERAVLEVCAHRSWAIHALAVRTNHVHVVSEGVGGSTKMLNDFKAYSTRALRKAGSWPHEHSPWVDKGSRRYLWTEDHMLAAINYVENGQGGPLPEFD